MLGITPFTVAVANEDKTFSNETYDEAQKFLSEPGRAHLIGILHDGKMANFLELMEKNFYPAGTKKNRRFSLRVLRWNEVYFSLASVPLRDVNGIQKLARTQLLMLKPSKLTMLDGKGAKPFPFELEHSYMFRLLTSR